MSKESFIAAIAVITGDKKKPRQKRDCEICGDEKSVGKYYVSKEDNPDAVGWWRVCSNCADTFTHLGTQIHYYKYSTEYKKRSELKQKLPDCEHVWEKHGLVGEFDKRRQSIFDWMKCEKCGCFGKRFGLGRSKIVDLSLEIDLSCSR